MDWQIYIDRGKQLVEVAGVADAATHPSALALLSVHSAIAFNDAVLVSLTGKARKAQDHQAAATETEKACHKNKIDDVGVQHLKKLLSAKTDISYGSRRTTEKQARALDNSARSFRAWAYKTLPAQRLE